MAASQKTQKISTTKKDKQATIAAPQNNSISVKIQIQRKIQESFQTKRIPKHPLPEESQKTKVSVVVL